MSKRSLAEDVISMLNKHGYVFGGYLRDEITGSDFSDVDMYFPMTDPYYDQSSLDGIISNLEKAGYVVRILDDAPPYGNHKLEKRTIEITKKGYPPYHEDSRVTFDLVRSKSNKVTPEQDTPWSHGNLDVDINCLYRHKFGDIRAGAGYNLDDVVTNIRNKVYAVVPGVFLQSWRSSKLRAKGFKDITEGVRVSTASENKQETSSVNKTESTDKPSLKDALKKAAIAGTYAAVAKETVDVTIAAIGMALKDNGADDSVQQSVLKFFQTEAGHALLSMGLGIALREVPMLYDQKFVPELSDKMLEGGVSRAESFALQASMKYLLPAIMGSLAGLRSLEKLGENPQMRVASAEMPPVKDNTLAQAELEAAASEEKQARRTA